MFKNILYNVSHTRTERQALANALLLAEKMDAELTLLATYSALDDELIGYQEVLKDSIYQYSEQLLQEAAAIAGVSGLTPEIKVISSEHNFVDVVRSVIEYGFDLVVKEYSRNDNGFYIVSDDMSMLRKCPCAVFMFQPGCRKLDEALISVAIKPLELEETSTNIMSLALLQTAHELCGLFGQKVNIISCYDTTMVEMVNDFSMSRISDAEMKSIEKNYKRAHKQEIENLIELAAGDDYSFTQLKGLPKEVIPAYLNRKKIDCLVLGTIGRSWIPGLIIGNSAESIVNESKSSVLVLKPKGFVSPIT
ncbi:universal stress protein [Marinobacterium arenosum]|uniref:universal stress protein n=1 Tax=Marinobacterium arenosum TaxID=2862496 RepID=UPI001C94CFC2|nr:universal stress protein [Marinobacterium arenosum]MBY4675071.1 universal stress protein [Marinobacterium arenosum]